jgi:hypothetical protein
MPLGQSWGVPREEPIKLTDAFFVSSEATVLEGYSMEFLPKQMLGFSNRLYRYPRGAPFPVALFIMSL